MDLVEGCRAFVHVAERGSFTTGAAAARTSQSNASRRIAALESELGGSLFDRGARRASLTVFGRRMLPMARALLDVADSLVVQARSERLSPLRVAVPEGWDVRDLAGLELAGRDGGMSLVVTPSGPDLRAQLVATDRVDVAISPCPAELASWATDLGLAGAVAESAAREVALLRPGRLDDPAESRTIWLLPEDDVPHVRDQLARHAESVGLLPSQVRVATSPARALADVTASSDVLLCSTDEADRFALAWRRLEAPVLRRGHRLVVAPNGVVAELDARAVAACLRAARL